MHVIWQDPFGAWLWVIANSLISISYLYIGGRHVLRYGGIDWLYGAFILACGFGHLAMLLFMGFFTNRGMWMTVIGLDTLTAAVSLATAVQIKTKQL